jgi:hypothetical protein
MEVNALKMLMLSSRWEKPPNMARLFPKKASRKPYKANCVQQNTKPDLDLEKNTINLVL